MSAPLEQPAAAHVDELVARMRGRLLDPHDCSAGPRVISGALGKQAIVVVRRGGQRSGLQPAGHCQSYGVCWAILTRRARPVLPVDGSVRHISAHRIMVAAPAWPLSGAAAGVVVFAKQFSGRTTARCVREPCSRDLAQVTWGWNQPCPPRCR